MPFAGHKPIHPRWSEHHRPVASGGHTGRCQITRPAGQGSVDGTGVWHPPDAEEVYAGPCRIVLNPAGSPTQVGDRQITTRSGTVSITWDAPEIRVHDLVTIVESADPATVGVIVRVTGIRNATQSWERVLSVSDDLTRREV